MHHYTFEFQPYWCVWLFIIFIAFYCSRISIYQNAFTSSSVHRHMGCFQVFAITGDIIHWGPIVSSGYWLSFETSSSVCINICMLNFTGGKNKLFSRWLYQLMPPIATSNCFIASWMLGIVRLSNFNQSCVWYVRVASICISVVIDDTENLFMYPQVLNHSWKISLHCFYALFLLCFFSISYCFRGSYICCK